jgi:glycosyltransferase involved in cell wall biosynthesis
MRVKHIPILRGGELPSRLHRNPVLCRMIFKSALVNVAPSGYLQKAFADAGFTRLVYIPNTIETQNYRFKKREYVAPKLLWVRSFSPIYNPAMALQVFKTLQPDYPDAQLCMVGPDKKGYLSHIRQMAQSQGLDVQFTGKLSKAEWAALSESFDIFINTTHFDNTPISVIEAMALGLPVVSTNVGGIPFLLEDRVSGLLVNDGDADAMVQAIKELIRQQGLAETLAQNAAALTAGFDFEKVRHRWFDILK